MAGGLVDQALMSAGKGQVYRGREIMRCT
jgi:hypothetical protein